MTQEVWTGVDRYINELVVRPDVALDAALADADAAGLPAINVAPNQGKLLALLAELMQARNILEIGTLAGYSTIWLARAAGDGGRVVTLEVDPAHAAVARQNLQRAGVADRVEVILGRAIETLPRLLAEGRGPFDLIFIDADKPSIAEYFTWSLKLSHPGTAIIVDNVVRRGAVIDPVSGDANVEGVRRFNSLLAAEPRVSATTIQTVGSKGYDGFTLARVNST